MTTTTLQAATRRGSAGSHLTLRALIATLRAMHERAVARRALARMDDRLLADIGVSREQARREAAKPIWIA